MNTDASTALFAVIFLLNPGAITVSERAINGFIKEERRRSQY